MRIDILGVKVDGLNISQALARIEGMLRSNQKHLVVTPYSEMIVEAWRNPQFKEILNHSSLSLPDGVGLLAAADFLGYKVPKNVFLRFFLLLAFGLITGFKLILARSLLSPIKQPVSGYDIVWHLVGLSAKKNYEVFLLGGRNGVAAKASEKLKAFYPNLNVSWSEGLKDAKRIDEKENEQIIDLINRRAPDILFVAYGPPYQEKWISDNLGRLEIKVALGVGGTFDMISGRTPKAPPLVRFFSLESLWRLVLQPWRAGRVYKAVVVFPFLVFLSQFLRKD